MNVSNKHRYNIGAVSRLTQIHPETIRVWERRYELVSPSRSDSGRRLYSDEDIERLSLVKQLTELGHSVSGLARLSDQELRDRLSTNQTKSPISPARTDTVCQVLFLDEALKIRLGRDLRAYADLEVVDQFARDSSQSRGARHEVLIMGVATVNENTRTKIDTETQLYGCESAVVVYNFGQPAAIREMERAGMVCLRAPVTPAEIRDACRALASANISMPSVADEKVSEHRFSAEQLAKVATLSGSIACECPNHLAELIINLSAFEQYSGDCENTNVKDAVIHAQLKQAAGKARNLLEDSLARLIEIEGIKV